MNSKMLGSIAIVAGTAIGAGMLALPLATAALGMIPAILLMVVIWGLSAYTSLLMLRLTFVLVWAIMSMRLLANYSVRKAKWCKAHRSLAYSLP